MRRSARRSFVLLDLERVDDRRGRARGASASREPDAARARTLGVAATRSDRQRCLGRTSAPSGMTRRATRRVERRALARSSWKDRDAEAAERVEPRPTVDLHRSCARTRRRRSRMRSTSVGLVRRDRRGRRRLARRDGRRSRAGARRACLHNPWPGYRAQKQFALDGVDGRLGAQPRRRRARERRARDRDPRWRSRATPGDGRRLRDPAARRRTSAAGGTAAAGIRARWSGSCAARTALGRYGSARPRRGRRARAAAPERRSSTTPTTT